MQIVEIMEKTFQAESGDIALYLAMSQKAADEGHSDIALYLYNRGHGRSSSSCKYCACSRQLQEKD